MRCRDLYILGGIYAPLWQEYHDLQKKLLQNKQSKYRIKRQNGKERKKKGMIHQKLGIESPHMLAHADSRFANYDDLVAQMRYAILLTDEPTK